MLVICLYVQWQHNLQSHQHHFFDPNRPFIESGYAASQLPQTCRSCIAQHFRLGNDGRADGAAFCPRSYCSCSNPSHLRHAICRDAEYFARAVVEPCDKAPLPNRSFAAWRLNRDRGGYNRLLTMLEVCLTDGRDFLTGDGFTEADLRLFPTLYRHEPFCYVRMRLNGARILDHSNLWRWLCRIFTLPGVAESNSLEHCRQGYFGRSWNKVVPRGPFKPMPYPEAYGHTGLAR